MNLCFINPSESRRPEIYGLAENLPKKYNITILHPSDKAKMRDNFYLRENIFVKYIPSIFMPLSDSMVTIPVFQKWIKELYDTVRLNKVDLIHVCDYEYLTSTLPIFIKRKYGNLSTVIVNDALIGIGNYSFGSLLMDLLSRTYTCALGIKVLKSYDKIILLYSELAEQAKKLGLPEGKIRIIPNGIDVKKIFDTQKRFDAESIRKKFGITDDEKVILYVGRLVKMKRVEIIITVIKKLLERNLKVKGLIVGDGPQRTELEKMARPINHHIKFTGYLSEERFECYHIADLFILPSISEGLPTVLLEGALFGLPIIATNTHGVPDVVIHGKTGFLASRWNYYDQYTEYAERLLRDQSLATEIGENARKYVARNFSWNKVVMKYEKVYKETAK